MSTVSATPVRDGAPAGATAVLLPERLLQVAPLAFIAIVVVGALTTQGFLTASNALAILDSTAFIGIIAVGMTAILISGNLFSMSLGTTVAVAAMAFLWGLRFGVVEAIALTLILGILLCAIQGAIVGALGANPIIVTIGAGALQSGAAVMVSGGASVFPPAGNTSFAFMNATIVGIAVPVYILLVLVVACELLLRRTRFGLQVYLVGESRRAATSAALPVASTVIGAFALAGFCAALAGILLGAFNQNATLLVQGTYNYDAIAAALVGGSAVTGGRGSVTRTLFGALVIGAISDMLLLRGYSTGAQIAVKGVAVLLVVVLVHLRARGQER